MSRFAFSRFRWCCAVASIFRCVARRLAAPLSLSVPSLSLPSLPLPLTRAPRTMADFFSSEAGNPPADFSAAPAFGGAGGQLEGFGDFGGGGVVAATGSDSQPQEAVFGWGEPPASTSAPEFDGFAAPAQTPTFFSPTDVRRLPGEFLHRAQVLTKHVAYHVCRRRRRSSYFVVIFRSLPLLLRRCRCSRRERPSRSKLRRRRHISLVTQSRSHSPSRRLPLQRRRLRRPQPPRRTARICRVALQHNRRLRISRAPHRSTRLATLSASTRSSSSDDERNKHTRRLKPRSKPSLALVRSSRDSMRSAGRRPMPLVVLIGKIRACIHTLSLLLI